MAGKRDFGGPAATALAHLDWIKAQGKGTSLVDWFGQWNKKKAQEKGTGKNARV